MLSFIGRNSTQSEQMFRSNCIPTFFQPGKEFNWFNPDTQQNFINRSYNTRYTDSCISYKFNQHGYRSDDFDLNAKVKVLVFGDSYSFGLGLPFDHIWFNLLKAMLIAKNEKFEDVKFFNFSKPADTFLPISILLDQVIDVIKPDCVLILGPTLLGNQVFLSDDVKSSQNIALATCTFRPGIDTVELNSDLISPDLLAKNGQALNAFNNLGSLFFSSFQSLKFIHRCVKSQNSCDIGIHFKKWTGPHNFDSLQEVLRFYPEFEDIQIKILMETFNNAVHHDLARDGIHVGLTSQTIIANEVLAYLQSKGILEKWNKKLNQY